MKIRKKNYTLTETQKKIIRYLAEKGPASTYRIAKSTGYYSNTHEAIKALNKNPELNLILGKQHGKDKNYLTDFGCIWALSCDAKPKRLQAHLGDFPLNRKDLVKAICNILEETNRFNGLIEFLPQLYLSYNIVKNALKDKNAITVLQKEISQDIVSKFLEFFPIV